MRQAWSKEEIEQLKGCVTEGLTNSRIAKKMKRSMGAIRGMKNKLGLRNYRKHTTLNTESQVKDTDLKPRVINHRGIKIILI